MTVTAICTTTWFNAEYRCDKCGRKERSGCGGVLPPGWSKWQPPRPDDHPSTDHDWLMWKDFLHHCDRCPAVGD